MASAKLRRKTHHNEDKFLSPERTRTIKPADFKNHKQLKDLSHDDLIELLCLMEAELQAKDVLLKAVLSSDTGHALPLSHLLNDVDLAHVDNQAEDKSYLLQGEEEDEVWLGEPSAHLNHVVAYHQVVREQMQTTVQDLQKVHKEVVEKLDEEYHKHAADTAQGDDVTYMLEKERERLQAQIDQEQTKYADLEKERDSLRETLEKERKDYYNAFNELMNDCKALAQQLVTQSSKYEKNQKDHDKHQKDIDKEKSKNKVLSELMVEETQKFKERLRQYEEEVRDFHVLEQKKTDLECKLLNSDKQMKEYYHQLNDERKKNSALAYELNQLRKKYQGEFTPEDDTHEDVLFMQDQYEIPVKEARTSTIQLSKPDRDSPEPSTVLPPAVPVQAKVATVTKSSSIRQTKNYSPQVNKSNNIVPLNNHASNNQRLNSSYVQAPDAQQIKRHSYEEKSNYNNSREEASVKRNSYEGALNLTGTPETSRTASLNKKPSSYEDMRNVGGAAALSVTPKRNSYEGDSKKIPPPAPPRRGSQLTPQDRPPIVKIPQQFQPRKSNSSTPSATDAYKQQNRSNSSTGVISATKF
uniref:Cortactin-binding protein-2 N-terminal domain-containing protein n=1 Tax=Clytia hemisphaerica TaxID=252671 RepID=A0A7M5V337_9CNID